MRESAKVDSIEALAEFRGSLCKFSEVVQVGLQEAESELQRTSSWLKNEQLGYWKDQIRKRAELVLQAKHALNRKKLYKTPTGGRYSTVDEEKALKIAKMRHEESELKFANVRRWMARFEKEVILYKGQMNALRQAAGVGIPKAVAHLDRLVGSLAAYVSLTAPVADRPTGSESRPGIEHTAEVASMARGGEDTVSDPADEYGRLRNLTPSRSVLDAARLQEPAFRWIDGQEIDSFRLRSIENVGVERTAAGGDEKVVLARDVWSRPRVYLERVASSHDGDSGWYVGSAEGRGGDPCIAVRVYDLLRIRPDLFEIMRLPKGFLVVLDSGSVEAVLDGDGNLVVHDPSRTAGHRERHVK